MPGVFIGTSNTEIPFWRLLCGSGLEQLVGIEGLPDRARSFLLSSSVVLLGPLQQDLLDSSTLPPRQLLVRLYRDEPSASSSSEELARPLKYLPQLILQRHAESPASAELVTERPLSPPWSQQNVQKYPQNSHF